MLVLLMHFMLDINMVKDTVGRWLDLKCVQAPILVFISSKQPVVAKSSREYELIVQNKLKAKVKLAREIFEEVSLQKKLPMLVNSKCAVQVV